MRDLRLISAEAERLWGKTEQDPSRFNLGTEYLDWSGEQAEAYGGREVAVPLADTETTSQQQTLAQALAARAYGEGPSVAEIQMRKGGEQAVRSAMALRGQRGGSPMAAQYAAQQQAANIGLATNREAGMLRAGEMAQAQSQYATFLSQLRGQQAQEQQFGAQLQQRQQAMNDQMIAYYETQGFSREQAQMQAQLALEQMNAQERQALMDFTLGSGRHDVAMTEANIRSAEAGVETGGKAISGIGSILSMFSDRRLKKNIKSNDKDMDEFLSALKNYSYEYKDGKEVKGERHGVMVQDLLKSRAGKSITGKSDDGMGYIDVKEAIGPILAALGRLNDKIDGK